jgi:hypothetical protein
MQEWLIEHAIHSLKSLELQSKNKCTAELMSSFILQKQHQANDHFPNMQDHVEKYHNFAFQTEKCVTEICYPKNYKSCRVLAI